MARLLRLIAITRLKWLTPAAMAIPPTPAWVLTVDTTDVNQTWTVCIADGTTPNITVDWDDGTVETFTDFGNQTHTYAAAGRHYPKITGSFASGGNIILGSDGENRSRLKATAPVPFIPGLANFGGTFRDCSGLTDLPPDLFRYNPLVSEYAFYETFSGCTSLATLPADLFRYNTLVSEYGFYTTFSGCTSLATLPADLFRYNPLVSEYGFYATFSGCTSLAALPADLFRYNPLVSASGFLETFFNCTSLAALPADLFRYNPLVSLFTRTFSGCTSLAALPADLFRYNTLVSESAFLETFSGCTSLATLPADLFRYNTLVSEYGFYTTFSGCTSLTTLPADLFRYNTLVSVDGFYATFSGCNKLQLRADIFFRAGEEGTRFLDSSPVFADCFRLTDAFTGTQGTAPALWSCDFGTGNPAIAGIFLGHTAASVTNHGSIPLAWGGPA